MKKRCKVCGKAKCPGYGKPGACSGTLETEAEPRLVTEAELDEVVKYELAHLHMVLGRVSFNPRMLLSIIRELRALRRLAVAVRNYRTGKGGAIAMYDALIGHEVLSPPPREGSGT